MADFQAIITNNKNSSVAKISNKEIMVKINGWNYGIIVCGLIDIHKNIIFNIYTSGGTNNPSTKVFIGRMFNEIFVKNEF